MKNINNIDDLSKYEKINYYKKLRDECMLIRDKQPKFGQQVIKNVYPLLRKYELELEGHENIPKDTNALFIVNHSNSHDIFTAYEFLSLLNRRGSVMVATDCLNPFSKGVFNIANATLFDRRNKVEGQQAVLKLAQKMLEGNDGVIFGESTWNLHPVLTMHNIKKGAALISAITDCPIVPVIMEYIERDDKISSEKDLYTKCVIRFGKAINVNHDSSLIDNTSNVKNELIKMRKKIWSDYSINREKLDDIDPELYVNHTYVKKFKALGFTYNSKKEQEYLLFLKNDAVENEYTLNDKGILVPGITEKSLKKILK